MVTDSGTTIAITGTAGKEIGYAATLGLFR